MKINLPLRLRVTFINIIVLAICTTLLTITSLNLASKTIDSVSQIAPTTNYPSTQSPTVEPIIPGEEIASAQILTHTVQAEKSKYAIATFKYMLVIIVLGGIITYLTTGKSLEGVKKLSHEIKDINEHNLAKKIKEEGPEDEIKDLTKSFNSMLNRIEDAFESQKQFSANVAHELRTPLAVIRMKIDV
ncbi:MAG: histidine kinase dimerization/phospho-acceptor domain-containing protein, partial [Peptostreptococcaceae bacterium]